MQTQGCSHVALASNHIEPNLQCEEDVANHQFEQHLQRKEAIDQIV